MTTTTIPSITVVDYRGLDFLDTVDRNLLCPICHCPFIKGSRLDCDHTFCSDCLRRALQAQTASIKTCPSCRTVVETPAGFPVPRFVVHMIDDLRVKCPQHAAGCMKQLRKGDVESHIRFYCEYAELPCPSPTCSMTITRKQHLGECLHGVVNCPDCKVELMKRDLQVGLRTAYTRSTQQS